MESEAMNEAVSTHTIPAPAYEPEGLMFALGRANDALSEMRRAVRVLYLAGGCEMLDERDRGALDYLHGCLDGLVDDVQEHVTTAINAGRAEWRAEATDEASGGEDAT